MSNYLGLGKAQAKMLVQIAMEKTYAPKTYEEGACEKLYDKGLISFVTVSGKKHYSITQSGRAAIKNMRG